ncbi:putative MFS family arabinose efflux permease [Salsuginibacillus halophilus]|uniref:Putative MFS family arabinose efflux permease n=1 Tax=Salsuginibacillus halophilus TaxID=517424 RepID=A0A2P8HDX0_9BACI|nr:MFS transporter [Salsuginibacillus halophilus]PSL44424.1 putative MFS family arabinose efflux permease [Salsuginibacillus halophilus]
MGGFVQGWRMQFQGYNRNVRLFLLASLLANMGMGVFMVIYNYYIRELGYSADVNGRVVAMQAAATAIVLLPAGIASDRVGRKKIILLGALFLAVSLFLRAVLVPESMLLAAAFMTGMFMAFIQVAAIPLLAENSTESQRVHLFSFNFALNMVAHVLGNALGGGLSDGLAWAFSISSLESVRYALLAGAVLSTCAILPVLKIQETRIQEKRTPGLSSWKVLFSTNKAGLKLILLFAVAQLLIGFGSGLVIPYLNLYFTDRFDITHAAVGMILALGQAMTAVAFMVGPAVVNKVGEVKAVVILQLSSLPFLLITAFTQNLWLAVIAFLFRQALMNAGNPIQMSLMMRKVDDSIKGLANSVGQMVFQLGWAVMGPVSTAIVVMYGDYYGWAFVFSLTCILYLTGSIYFYLVFIKRA